MLAEVYYLPTLSLSLSLSNMFPDFDIVCYSTPEAQGGALVKWNGVNNSKTKMGK
jgi:hypothetical protein